MNLDKLSTQEVISLNTKDIIIYQKYLFYDLFGLV